jgi:AcrR family transcriptional regulator
MSGMPVRAPALPPEQRRAAIIAATLPLVLQCGANVSTRQIADAAGIAEGTIFGVFPDKDAVVQAVLMAALDPEPTERKLASIDRSRPFEDQLADAVVIMQRRAKDISRLLSGVGNTAAPHTPPADFEGLADILKAHRGELRTDAVTAARQLRAITLAVSTPMFFAGKPMTPREIVALFLDGVRVPQRQPALVEDRA